MIIVCMHPPCSHSRGNQSHTLLMNDMYSHFGARERNHVGEEDLFKDPTDSF